MASNLIEPILCDSLQNPSFASSPVWTKTLTDPYLAALKISFNPLTTEQSQYEIPNVQYSNEDESEKYEIDNLLNSGVFPKGFIKKINMP